MTNDFFEKQDEIRRTTRRRNLKIISASDIYLSASDEMIELINYLLIESKEKDSFIQETERRQRKELIDSIKKTHTITYNQIVSIVRRLYEERVIIENFKKRIVNNNLPNNLELSQSDISFTMDSIQDFYHHIEEIISSMNIIGRTDEEIQENIVEFKKYLEEIIKQIADGIKIYELERSIIDYEEYSKICNDIISEIDKNNYPLTNVKNACIEYINNFTRDNEYIIEVINYYNDYIKKQYEQQLTKPDNYKSGENFEFIVHNIKGIVPENPENFTTPIVSASLITQNTLGLYGTGAYEDSEKLGEINRYGFILPPELILAAKEEDLYVNNSADSKTDIFNGNHRKEAILSPSTIEERCLELAKNIGSDQLSEEAQIYSEVVVDGFNPIGIFCITNGEGELNYSYRNAKQLLAKFNLSFIEIDQSLYRKKAGLQPYTDYSKKILTLNVIEALIPNTISNYYNNMLVKEYLVPDIAEEICRIFDELKEQTSYTSENLLDISVGIIRNKINYYKENPNYFNYNSDVFNHYMYINNFQYDYIEVLNCMIKELDNYDSKKNKLEESSDRIEYESRKSEFEQASTAIKLFQYMGQEVEEINTISHGKSL